MFMQPFAEGLSSADFHSRVVTSNSGTAQVRPCQRCSCLQGVPNKRSRVPGLVFAAESRLRRVRAKNTNKQQHFKSSRDPGKTLVGGEWLDRAKAGWKTFSEQASSPSTVLSGAATATAAVLLALPFNSSFPSNIAWIIAARPAEVSADTWLLSLAIISLLPAAIYVGMTWRVLHKIKHGRTESDRAVAVVAALCVRNAQTIEQLNPLLDGLDSHPSIGPAVLKLREATRKQLTLQQLLFSKMEVAEQFTMGQQLQQALLSCSAEVDRAGLTMAEATDLLDFEKAEAVPANSLTYKIDKYDKILALMVLRQRGMRLTIVSILEDLAVKLPPVRHHIGLVQKQFTQRFEHEDVMMRQITPPGFNAAEKVRHLLHTQEMVTNLAERGMKPDEVLGTLLGPWGASSPQTDLERHKMEKMVTGALADSSEVRSAKQDLEKLMGLQLSSEAEGSGPKTKSKDSALDLTLEGENADMASDSKQSDQQHSADAPEGSS